VEPKLNSATHYWARFEYTNTLIGTNFGTLAVYGPANNTTIKTVSKVTLADDSRFEFAYTSWGQVWKVTSLAADNSVVNYRTYDLPTTAGAPIGDCPRFAVRKDWAKYWNGDTDGTPAANEEVATASFIAPANDTWTMPDNSSQTGIRAEVTAADGTLTKIYYIGTATSSGWRRGLPALVETHVGGSWKRKVMTIWTQDNTSLSYPLNPRVLETNVYDVEGNRARTEITYEQFDLGNGMSCHLPGDLYEYDKNATTILRSTRTLYNMSSAYKDRRILGLVSEKQLYEGTVSSGILQSKVAFFYDESGSIQGTDAPVQHDNTNYTASFLAGRGNLSSVKRYNVDNTAEFTTTRTRYNAAGAVVFSEDASEHAVTISYADSFSDGNNSRNTLAYPTTVTDPDLFSSNATYNFDFGAVTRKQTPQPNLTTNTPGPQQFFEFDSIGRLLQITNSVNSAHTRFEYSNTLIRVDTYATIEDWLGEAHSFRITDGAGRVVATASDHPGSVGGFSGQKMMYDVMGRTIKTSNPTETNASGHPAQWATAGDDAAAGWIYTQQTYDWKGRPLVTTNQDGTTKTASYSGCGCAGGEIVTLTDEGTMDAGVTKQRQQKIYSDVLGRTWKLELLNWDGNGPFGTAPENSIYSTTVTTYDARDQVTEIRQYAGPEGSGTYQDTTMTYEGYGRLKTRHTPSQQVDSNNPASTDHVTWDYNSDDTVQKMTDARGAVFNFSYNSRHLVTDINYSLSPGVPTTGPARVAPAASVSFSYDAAGNRVTMVDGFGAKNYQYNQLSQLTQEIRQFSVGSFPISYAYNLAGQLTGLTDPFGASFSYTRDAQGRLKTVVGSPYAGVTNYVNDVAYRAWGAPKSIAYSGRSSTIGFNSRMQPTQFRLTATNGASIIRENYSYFADGRLDRLTDLDDTAGSNPPASLRFLSRGYSYDQVGRVVNGRGTGNAGSGVPFNQSYTYDAFGNMIGRSGSYYNYNTSAPTSDTATYINDRRSNWSYNADGQVRATPFTSTDQPRSMVYDVAGRMSSTVETGQNNTITYAAQYDGDGRLCYESSNTVPGTFTASFIVRSTVLGGEVLTRLDSSGNKLTTHVPAERLLFATQRSSGAPGPLVMMTDRNPLGISETSMAVYDPLGNYIPFKSYGNPIPPPGSYSSASMSGLSSSQANAQSYGVGCVMDGVPTNCKKVMEQLEKGRARKVEVLGPAITSSVTRLMMSLTPVGGKFVPASVVNAPKAAVELSNGRGFTSSIGAAELWLDYILAPGVQRAFEQNPQNPGLDPSVSALVSTALASSDCIEFAQTVLNGVSNKKNPVFAASGSLIDVFNAFLAQGANHPLITRNKPSNSWGYGNPVGKIKHGDAAIFSPNGGTTGSEADTVISELFHLAGSNKYYTDEQLAKAVHNSSYASDAAAVIAPEANIFDKQHYQARGWRKDQAYSAYFHYIQMLHCTAVPQPPGHPRRIN
jgi:YD repeat-containing protein